MGSQIQNVRCQKHLLCLQFISDIQSQVITDARLECIKLRARIRDRSAGGWKCLSVNPAVDGCLFFSVLKGRMRQQRERNWLRIPYALSKIHWASDPQCLPHPLQPLGCAGSLDLYLSRRQCNSRFRCTQLFNTTLYFFK